MKKSLCFAAIAAVFLVSDAFADEIRYEAVWHSGQQTSLHTAPLSREVFLQTGQQLAESDLRLIDVESTIRGGNRLYAGLWTKGSGSNLFEGPISAIEMRDAMNEKRSQGMRLIDFELFRSRSGGRRYLAVWRTGTGEELLTGPMQQDAFFARGKRLTKDGLRLIDIEVEVVDGVLLYSGLFRTGTGSNLITAPLSHSKFIQKRDEMVAEGLELTDMERIQIGNNDRFVGVWSSGNGESRVSQLRDFGPHFILAQSQYNDGKYTEDFELKRIASQRPDDGTTPRGGGRVDPTVLPDNPPEFIINDSPYGNQRLVIEWSYDSDHPFTIELPASWLPDWLPHKSGVPVLPNDFCALNIRRADSIFWQVPGDNAVVTPPFLAIPSVEALGSEFFLGGVLFSGPFGACSDTQTEFVFDFPFTTGEFLFEPLPNMRLVIEGAGGGLSNATEIDFLQAGAPKSEPVNAFELFEDDTKEKLEGLLEAFADLFGGGENIEDYCQTVGNYWGEVCSANPAACPVAFPQLPDC
jgi:Polyglycine hydrolase-like, structural repeat